MTAARERLRTAARATRATLSDDGWFGYGSLDRPLTRRERWLRSRARRILAAPTVIRRAVAELAANRVGAR